jgi:membrane associated rhomboid family serine protease
VQALLILGVFIRIVRVPAIVMLVYWFAIQLLGGSLSLGREGGGVAFWAHIGGFVAGAVLVWPFRRRQT